MAPRKNTTKNTTATSSTSSHVSFLARGTEGENVERIICTPKYITLDELRKPATVTDRLRRDYQDLKVYDRKSMKGGIQRILKFPDVIKAVNEYWNSPSINSNKSADSNDEDDSLVSVEKLNENMN